MSDEVFEIFREEAREHLGALEKSFLDLETADGTETRRQLIDNAFRHAHSMKSDAKVVGLPELKDAAQKLEDILDELRETPEAVDSEAIDRGLAQFDQVRGAYESWNGDEPAATEALAEEVPITAKVEEPAESQITPATETSKPSVAPATPEESFSVRVPSERLDRMLNLAGGLRISQRSGEAISNRLDGVCEQLEQLKRPLFAKLSERRSKIEDVLDQLRRIDRELGIKRSREALQIEALENDIRRVRLLPLVMLADSLRRTVRDLSHSLGKAIAYQVDVGNIMLDKAVIESLKSPLTHLIRNAADHGIESVESRRAAGKPSEATIRIDAVRRGQLVRITVSDDGRGVDFDSVRKLIARRGGLGEGEIAQLSEHELVNFLFKAGFSTASTGDISGRGVGLDVVLDTVRRLQGHVQLESSSPAGTVFALTVPVTVSTVRILTVVTAGERYGIPSLSVTRTGRASRNELRELEGSLVLPVNGQPIRWVHLADLVGGQVSQQVNNAEAYSYLLVRGNGTEWAIAVDDLEDESEVLLKPLGYPLTGLPGLLGATFRADGSVQLVLDFSDRRFANARDGCARPIAKQQAAGRILVVDDSPTTRTVLRNVFAAAGYIVLTATDGIDALEQLAARTVDVVISDVEMPRLNGFDLTRQIKSKFSLPVILVTGREKEEHRREGLDAGADAYVVKSTFEDKGLLEMVEQFV